MLSRATSIPACTSSTSRSGVSEAGPRVHTMFALRTRRPYRSRLAHVVPPVLVDSSAPYAGSPTGHDVQRVLQVGGVVGLERHVLAARGVGEAEPNSMEPLALQPEPGREHRIAAVHEISDARVVDGSHVHADLVGATGLQVHLQQSRADE